MSSCGDDQSGTEWNSDHADVEDSGKDILRLNDNYEVLT